MFKSNENKIFKLIEKGDATALRHLVKNKPETLNQYGGSTRSNTSPLSYAVKCEQLGCLEVLLEYDKDVDRQDNDSGFWTALHWSMRANNTKFTQILLEHGADPLLKTGSGQKAMNIDDANPKAIMMVSKHIENQKYAAQIKGGDNGEEFDLENKSCVSKTIFMEASKMTIKRIFDFESGNIFTVTKDKDGQSNSVMAFNQAANMTEIEKAGRYLVKKGGNDHNWSTTHILSRPIK